MGFTEGHNDPGNPSARSETWLGILLPESSLREILASWQVSCWHGTHRPEGSQHRYQTLVHCLGLVKNSVGRPRLSLSAAAEESKRQMTTPR